MEPIVPGTPKVEATPPQAVEGLLKELLGARKALKLYPATNPLAIEWLKRVHRVVEALVAPGPLLRLRVTQLGFEWDGGQLTPRDQALEAFRFELATRKITEIAFTPGVEAGELRELLDFLNDTARGAGEAGLPTAAHILLGGSLSRYGRAEAAAPAEGGDLLDAAVGETLDALAALFREITFDRLRLSAWFGELTRAGEDAGLVFRAFRMLIPLAEAEPDREIRYRTLAETLMALPDPLRITVVRAWLLPAVRTDHEVIALLTRFSADELAELAGHIPVDELRALRADIEASPIEEWTRLRMSESLEEALADKDAAAMPLSPLIADDDPVLLDLREQLRAACVGDRVLEHSVAVLYRLVGETESETYPALLVDALEEAVTEALRLDRLGLAVEILRWIARPEMLRPEWQAEHLRRSVLLRRRLAGRAQVALLADGLGRGEDPDRIGEAAAYLRALTPEAIDEFVDILGDRPDGDGRARMLEVLTALGPDAVPAARRRLTDERWLLVRTMITVLAAAGDATSVEAIARVAGHPDPHVRREAARALAALGGPRAIRWILGVLADTDQEVRRTALKALPGLLTDATVSPIRDFLLGPARTVADLLVRREVIVALASSGRPEAAEVLDSITRRWLWPWQRQERKIRALARGARPQAPGLTPAPPSA